MSTVAALYRKRLSQERGTVKKDWGGRLSVALIYPSYYRVGMSSLGFQTVYGILNDHPAVVCERVFLPDEDERAMYKRREHPLLSHESQAPVRRFDLLAFSLSFENDYPHVLTILDLADIPLMSEERDEGYPLISAGGVVTFMNPEPLSGFMDFFLLGEAEVVLKGFLKTFLSLRASALNRADILRGLAQEVKGLYCPSLYKVEYKEDGSIGAFEPTQPSVPSTVAVPKRTALEGFPSKTRILTPSTEFSDTTLVELNRGCGTGCRFCAAGFVYRPPRLYQEADLKECLGEVVAENQRLGLVSPSVSDVPNIEALTGYIVERGGCFTTSSLRASSLSEKLLANLSKGRQKTLTIAIETGTDRLRKVINKKLTNKEILDAVIRIARSGFFHLKLYFMIGLPTETKEDIKAIVSLVKSIRHHIIKESKGRKKIGRLRLSINCFIPKPFTPFQWLPMDTVDSLKEKQRFLKKALSQEGGVTVGVDVPRWAYIQSLLSLGDRRVGRLLLSTHTNGGNWKQTFRSSDLNPDFFVYRQKALDEILPWDFIDHGINKSYLKDEYRLALSATESPACAVGACTRCGVCG
ncbi:MAG: radical SAM protein [Thermodesulfobacteriota bacterium]